MQLTRGFFASLRMTMPPVLLGAALLAFAGAGCSHYRLGTEAKVAFSTLYVEPVSSRTLLPQALEILSTQLREKFARDGRVVLVSSPEGADATLKTVITGYHREVATVREGDTGLARKFTLTLAVTCTLHDNHAGKDLLTARPVSTHRDAFTDGGQLQSEYQTLPLLAESLADKVTHVVLDVW